MGMETSRCNTPSPDLRLAECTRSYLRDDDDSQTEGRWRLAYSVLMIGTMTADKADQECAQRGD